jgi:hypothetical protein
MEKEYEVKTLLLKYFCDDCQGEVLYKDGNILMSDPPKFKHHCVNCNKEYLFNHKYPYTKYEYV